ncbi:formate--tetrahydrofolate ligase [Rikenella microfusus]|uniref:Formate--tetrahydrofolate ligase n=1 Tax=Rikenella microfusus TaxID=28139 RepID=A0A379MUW8_9BACT|nr:formate--tetrahydrofolate ligase [Rikenella microfusus]SUE34657.1 Formate--tetrahydrofolate ligase [Rikenella microfusus]
MKTDIEIARSVRMKPVTEVARQLGIAPDDLELYGKYKAKVPLSYIDREKRKNAKLILVSAISPTPAGEGKTTVSIGLSQALNRIGKRSCVVLREPSLGPVFGLKGGATGGGLSQVLPMEDINLHFTGDFAAIEKAHNLLAALIDNNIQSKTRSLGLDPRTISWKRVMDMNDRSLRHIVAGLGGTASGVPRETGFDITAASEVMAILCLATSIADLKRRLGNIFVGFTYDKKPVYARDLHAEGAMAALLKDAIKPNLVQTLEGTPALIHGGPFANIAQGTNTVVATEMSLSLTDYTVTEAGFGFDLGAEKFLDIKCRAAGLSPNAVVLVATVRALKYHGGQPLKELKTPDVEALERGIVNLQKHIENIGLFGLSPVVAINKFATDSDEELQFIRDYCTMRGVPCAVADVWGQGGAGTEELAGLVAETADHCCPQFKPLYPLDEPVTRKVETIAKNIYGAEAVDYTPKAKNALKRIADLGLDALAICMAKTQKSLSDNPALLGRPKDFVITVRDIEIAAGAGFLIPITGEIMRMPGLPEEPAAEHIDIDDEGNLSGLF